MTYVVADAHQHIGVIGVVCDLHQRIEGKVQRGETLSKVPGDKDTRSTASGHFACQEHLQAGVQKFRPMKNEMVHETDSLL